VATRIIVNGQEYPDVSVMPPEVRSAYEAALAQLKDIDGNGVPDGFEAGGNSIVVRQSGITVNGQSFNDLASMPPPLRVLLEWGLRQAVNQGASPPALSHDSTSNSAVAALPATRADEVGQALDRAERTVARALQLLLAMAAGVVIAVGSWIIAHMDAGSRIQGGRIYLGAGVVVALVLIVATYTSIERRLHR
jgi:hypothetical protein